MSVQPSFSRQFAIAETVIVAALALPVVRLAVSRMPLPRLRRMLRNVFAARGRPDRITAHDVGRCVAGVGRRLPGIGTCLTHALVTEALLHRFRLPAEFVIGVDRLLGAEISAHAWVVSDGVVVVGDAADLGRFVPLTSAARTLKPPQHTLQSGKEVMR